MKFKDKGKHYIDYVTGKYPSNYFCPKIPTILSIITDVT